MRASFFCSRYTSGRYSLSDLCSEARELWDELVIGNPIAAREEFFDCLVLAQGLIHQRTGLDFTMMIPLSHVTKYERRTRVWRALFTQNGLAFSPKYLVGGSNFRKPHKVQQALDLARRDQGKV